MIDKRTEQVEGIKRSSWRRRWEKTAKRKNCLLIQGSFLEVRLYRERRKRRREAATPDRTYSSPPFSPCAPFCTAPWVWLSGPGPHPRPQKWDLARPSLHRGNKTRPRGCWETALEVLRPLSDSSGDFSIVQESSRPVGPEIFFSHLSEITLTTTGSSIKSHAV